MEYSLVITMHVRVDEDPLSADELLLLLAGAASDILDNAVQLKDAFTLDEMISLKRWA